MRTREERPRKCRKQRPGQTAPQFEDEELWGSTLDSVLSSVPLQDIQASFWAVLGWQERRALRSTNKALKEISDACVTGTCIVVNSPACPKYHHQVTLFPQLNRIDLCKGPDKRVSRRSGALLRDNLLAAWGRVQTLKISAFTGPGPSVAFPALSFQRLQVLELNTVDLETGDLLGLSTCASLTSLDLNFVIFKAASVMNELGSIRCLETLKMDTCTMQSFSFEFTSLSGLTNLLSMDLTHVDRMCGSPHWRKDLGSALETLVSLRTIRLDAGEYGTVVETEGILPDSLQLEFNRGLMPITSLRSLESLAMDFLLTDDGWEAASQLPKLTEVIVEGISLAEPRPGIMTHLEDLTINRATPAQLLRLLPLPSLRRLHVLFIPVSASSLAELDIIQADLLRASQLLIEPSARAAAEAEALASGSGLPPSPSPPLDIWAGLQLVAESTTGNADEEVLRDGKQIGAGGFSLSLKPLQSILRTLCLQSMSITRMDAFSICSSLPLLHELVFISCALDQQLLSALHPLDRGLRRLSILYGCSWVSAAQVSSFCIAAAASRTHHSGLCCLCATERPKMSSVLELEISSDSMSLEEQLEAQRVLMPYSAVLSLGSVRLMLVADRDLAATLQNAEAAQAAAAAAGGGVGLALPAVAVDAEVNVPPAIVIGALEPMVE